MSLKRLAAAWQRGGTSLAARVMLDRACDFCWEHYFGVDSAGLIPIETLLSEWHGCHDYFPSSRKPFHSLMALIDVHAGRDVFVDFGAGKGRALLMAAQYPFKRVVGIEISEALCREARRNVARWRAHSPARTSRSGPPMPRTIAFPPMPPCSTSTTRFTVALSTPCSMQSHDHMPRPHGGSGSSSTTRRTF